MYLLDSSNTTSIKGKTLNYILWNERVSKVFFDICNDPDALFGYFGVALSGVEDIQLMESATRTTMRSRKYFNGLARFMGQVGLYGNDLASWKPAKEYKKTTLIQEAGHYIG